MILAIVQSFHDSGRKKKLVELGPFFPRREKIGIMGMEKHG